MSGWSLSGPLRLSAQLRQLRQARSTDRAATQDLLEFGHSGALRHLRADGRFPDLHAVAYDRIARAIGQALGEYRQPRAGPRSAGQGDVQQRFAGWVALATGDIAWPEAERSARVRASGERADLTPYLPLG